MVGEDNNRELNFKEDIEITLKNKDEVIEKDIRDELGTINTIDTNNEEDKKMLNVTNKTKFEKNKGPQKMVNVPEGRGKVSQTQLKYLPYKCICKISIKGTNGHSYIGTGIYISPRIVLTAAHNLYYYQMGGDAIYFEITPGFYMDGGQYGTTKAHKLKFPGEFLQYEHIDTRNSQSSILSRPYDYGVIITTDRLGDKTGFLDILKITDNELASSQITICGYPYNDLPAGFENFRGKVQFEDTNDIQTGKITPNLFENWVDTSQGQSGSPCLINRDNTQYIVGIHIGDGNFAVRVNDKVYNKIQEWKQQFP
jgi:glutamyl endopeptidase